MTYAVITALILSIASSMGLPEFFCLSIALTENPTLDPNAVSKVNYDSSQDLGVFQLSNRFFYDERIFEPEYNIRNACKHIKTLIDHPGLNTYWGVAASYNCGIGRFLSKEGPPSQTIEYACCVMERWDFLSNGNSMAIIERKR